MSEGPQPGEVIIRGHYAVYVGVPSIVGVMEEHREGYELLLDEDPNFDDWPLEVGDQLVVTRKSKNKEVPMTTTDLYIPIRDTLLKHIGVGAAADCLAATEGKIIAERVQWIIDRRAARELSEDDAASLIRVQAELSARVLATVASIERVDEHNAAKALQELGMFLVGKALGAVS